MHNVCGQWREVNDVGCVCTLSPYHMSTLTSCYSHDYYGIYFQNRQTCSGLYSTATKGSRWMPHLVYFQTQYNFALPFSPHLQLICPPFSSFFSSYLSLLSFLATHFLCFFLMLLIVFLLSSFFLSISSFIFFKFSSSFSHISL